MATSFASRLSGLRQAKKEQTGQAEQGQLRLTLPADTSEKSAYEPSTTFSNTRTSFRLLKGRIDRGQSSDKQEISSSNTLQERRQPALTQKLSLPQEPKTEMKLFLNDEPGSQEKVVNEPPKVPLQKRILISKEPPKEEPKKQEPPKLPKPPKKQEQPLNKQSSSKQIRQEDRPIHEDDVEQSLPPESQNDLVQCPEGCGRKFNRKALEKHAKACKLVFMSKRKEFNSEAKRLVSKEQTAIAKQQKIGEKKKMGATRGKGFEKTGQNWKAASEDFRAAIKAMKRDEAEGEEAEIDVQIDMEGKKVNTVQCQYCQKQFNEVFIEQHIQNCPRKKDRDRSKKRPVKK